MAVKIRLMRMGKKKQPTYRVVVADSRSPRDGRIIERIGIYAPRREPSTIEIDQDRALHWLNTGAQPSESVQKLLESAGVWDAWKAQRPAAATTAKRKLDAHKLALANRPAPEPAAEEQEPAAEEPAAEEQASASEEPASEEQEPASEEPASEASASEESE